MTPLPSMLITPDSLHIPITPLTNAVINPTTGETQEYQQLIANPETKLSGYMQQQTNLVNWHRASKPVSKEPMQSNS
jgi:hypothetical protein